MDNYIGDLEEEKTNILKRSKFKSSVPEIIALNRSYSFTNEELEEMSFESSDIWNISTDNEKENMLIDEKR